MKIVHQDIEQKIDFDMFDFYCLTIENAHEFFKLTNQLYSQINGEEGDFVLSKNANILSIAKYCAFVYDYYGDFLNNKKTLNLVNNNVLDIIQNNDFLEDFSKLNAIILKINEKITNELHYAVNYKDDINAQDFVKLSTYKLQYCSNLLENICSFIQVVDKNIIIFINLYDFLSYDEINDLVKQLKYMQINALFINSHTKYKIDDIKDIIIDEDLCVI